MREGAGLSFLYYAPTSTVVAVPVALPVEEEVLTLADRACPRVGGGSRHRAQMARALALGQRGPGGRGGDGTGARRARGHPPARATRLLLLCDGGGSNSASRYVFKEELQGLADRLGLEVRVAHYPPYCSKYNPIEHRLFGPISLNWAGQPLATWDTMLGSLRGTTSATGLTVRAALHDGSIVQSLGHRGAEVRACLAGVLPADPQHLLPTMVLVVDRAGAAHSAGRFPYLEDVTADFAYVRLHGNQALYVGSYTDAELDAWSAKIRDWAATDHGEPLFRAF